MREGEILKPVKIKRNYNIYSNRRKQINKLLKALAALLVCAGLVGIGFLISEPISKFLSGEYNVPPAISSSSGSSSSSDETVKPPEVKKEIMSIDMPTDIASDAQRRAEFIKDAKAKGYTAVSVEYKGADGIMKFYTENETWTKAGIQSAGSPLATDIAKAIKDEGLIPIARVSTFADTKAAYWNRDMAIGYGAAGVLWLDNAADAGGKPWLNPYNAQAQELVKSQITAVYTAGFSEVVLTGLRFPQYGGAGSMAYYGDVGGVSREQVLKNFVESVKSTVKDGCTLGVEVPYDVCAAGVNEMYPITYFDTGADHVFVSISKDNAQEKGALPDQIKSTVLSLLDTVKSKGESTKIIPQIPRDIPGFDDVVTGIKAGGILQYEAK